MARNLVSQSLSRHLSLWPMAASLTPGLLRLAKGLFTSTITHTVPGNLPKTNNRRSTMSWSDGRSKCAVLDKHGQPRSVIPIVFIDNKQIVHVIGRMRPNRVIISALCGWFFRQFCAQFLDYGMMSRFYLNSNSSLANYQQYEVSHDAILHRSIGQFFNEITVIWPVTWVLPTDPTL